MEDHRKQPRYVKRLRAVIIEDEGGKLAKTHGKTHDISLGGVSVISPYALHSHQAVTVCVLIEQGGPDNPPLMVAASCKMVSCVLSGQQGGFRLGFQFIKFENDGEKVLKKFLAPGAKPTHPLSANKAPPVTPVVTPEPEPQALPVTPVTPQAEPQALPTDPVTDAAGEE